MSDTIKLEVEPYWGPPDDREFDENAALAVLFANNVLFLNGFFRGGKGDKMAAQIYVMCNDVFAWGTSDLEPMSLGDLEDVYKAYAANEWDGVIRWCCIHRNVKPQLPVEEAMRKAGVWDDVLEALPEGEYREYMKKRREERLAKEKERGA